MSKYLVNFSYFSIILLLFISCGGGGGSSGSGGTTYGSEAATAATCTSSATNFCVTTVARSYGAGNIYQIDGTSQKALTLAAGTTYTFDVSSSTVSSHPLKFSTTADGKWATPTAGTEYTTGITAGTSSITFAVTNTTPQNLYYYCNSHSGMGGTITISGGAAAGYSPPEQINPLD